MATVAAFDQKHLLDTLEELVAEELEKFQWFLNQNVLDGFSPIPKGQLEKANRMYTVDKMVQTYYADGALKMTLTILRKMNKKDLAVKLRKKCQTGTDSPDPHPLPDYGYKDKNKRKLKSKYDKIVDRMTKRNKNATSLKKIYAKHHITETGRGDVNKEHEVRQIERAARRSATPEEPIICNDIFKPAPGQNTPTRNVLTKGIAGIGKTVSTGMFILDWADGKANEDIDFIFPLPFRQLNLLEQEPHSLTNLVHRYCTEIEKGFLHDIFTNVPEPDERTFKLLFILDGLDEFRTNLNYKKYCGDVTEETTIDVLLTNLITGSLLPNALVWITSRPVAANLISDDHLDLVTEIRGFSDEQKEEYFRNRCDDENQADRFIQHIKASRTLFIMCHVPVFCSIIASVLGAVEKSGEEMPTTLTQMYTHFLVVQLKQKNVRNGKQEEDPVWDEENINMIQSLGKLAFQKLETGKLIFYDKDLRESGIDVRDVCGAGVCTELFSKDEEVSEDRGYCFVHLSVQELFSALYVFLSFNNDKVNLMQPSFKRRIASIINPGITFYKSAVDKALQSENGHLDLFLRFLLGLSQESNQTRLGDLLTRSSSQNHEKTVKCIKKKIKKNPTSERCINLFHCLNELNDNSLVKEIQDYLSSGSLSEDLSPSHWSALSFVLLTSASAEELDVFDLKKYSRSDEGVLGLLTVVKASRCALLNSCNLSEQCCEVLASALTSSDLIDLDLSGNDLKDAGVNLLSVGLRNSYCKLEILRLSGCLVTEKGCVSIASALRSNPSHLRELDLSYNHPGNSGVQLLSAGLEDPNWRLEKLNVDHCGEFRIRPVPRRYAVDLRLDPNTAHFILYLSEENRKVTGRNAERHPGHPERFENTPQVLCREGLSGRCYWEVEMIGRWVRIGVAYKQIRRNSSRTREGHESCVFGYNDKSWSLSYDGHSYWVWHDNKNSDMIPAPPSSPLRVGVFLDWPAGTLSFFSVSSDTLTHLYTYNTSFTDPLHPGFWIGRDDHSVTLCEV